HPLELLEVGGQALGDPVQERIDVALVVPPEGKAELHLLHLLRRDPGAGRRGVVRSLLPPHAVVPLRQQFSAARRTARITNAIRMDMSSPTPPARIGGISARSGRRTGSVTSFSRSRIVRSGPEYGGRNPNMNAHEMI